MPELPEVETIRQYLRQGRTGQAGKPDQPPVLGRRIQRADVLWPRTLDVPPLPEFAQRIAGQRINEIGRRGKHLILKLDQDALLFHLRMSGDILVAPATEPASPYDRLVLHLEDDWRLAFNDTRKFGRAWLVKDPQEVVGNLGPEPLEAGFTPEWLYAALQRRKRLLKPLLLDQAFIAGLGNIYTDEALHRSSLHPLMLSNQVTISESQRLWESIRFVLEEGIRTHGASIDWVYRGGDFQNHFRVYQRTGAPCQVCGAAIEKITVGQRGTHFCPHCQRLERHG